MRRNVWPIVLAALVALGASPRGQSAAPAAGDYAAAVQKYVADHDAGKAVGSLAAWTAGHFETAIEQYLAQPEAMQAAAAVLQLEIGLGVVTRSPALASQHLELGHLIVRTLRATLRLLPDEATAFAERWYVAAASTCLMVNDPACAAPFINRGLQAAPASLDLRLMAGILDDLEGLSLNPDDARGGVARGRLVAARLQAFLRAKDRYAKLVDAAPSFVRARVRLGRVLWMLGEVDAAQVELLRAQAEAREPVQQYLAAMFLGALYEQKGDVARARRWYESALAAAPASQAATVALGYLDVMAGRPDRAQALARALLTQPRFEDEWWSYKNGGVEREALAWLRQRVWQ
ncbi:MAG: hypothetical protein Q8O42_16665 [Acidobacteriota bacterium]|nr:hypothetical protein [Acidobacteriota bacterium]